jgi:hypothetical protein
MATSQANRKPRAMKKVAAAKKPAAKPAVEATASAAAGKAPAPKPAALRPALAPAKEATKAAKAAPKPAKLRRDSFRMPEEGFEQLKRLKRRARGLGRPARKSELLRAGLSALERMSDEAFAFALEVVPRRAARA